MSLVERAANIHKTANAKKEKAPAGFEPGLTWTGDRGELVTEAIEFREGLDVWDDIIREYTPMDPATVQVVEPVTYKQWTMPGSEVPHYHFKLTVVSRSATDMVDIDALLVSVRKRKARKPKEVNSDFHLHVNLADWQTGKGDGDGMEGLAERVEKLAGSVVDRIKLLNKTGQPVCVLHVNGLGDLVEGCRGFYSGQHFQTVANFRTQERFLRRAILELLDVWSPEVAEIHVHAVGGNHGERRNSDGGADTDVADNVDVAVFETVADICAANPGRYSNIAWQIPEEDLTLTYAHGDMIVGLAHGHQASGKDILKWWQGQAYGKQPVGDADVLVTGHYHHLRAIREGERTWFQCPSLEGKNGSRWWKERTGQESPPGTLSFVTDGHDWMGMEIL